MNITISLYDGVPIYRQIANQIRYLVASAILMPREDISSVRALALTLSVTPNTVVRAYAEPEASAVIYKRRGAGTYISDERSPPAEQMLFKSMWGIAPLFALGLSLVTLSKIRHG
jgi:GntR family transcriptional regulator